VSSNGPTGCRTKDHGARALFQTLPGCIECAGLEGTGLYRVRSVGSPLLLYVGEGRIRARLLAHRHKVSNVGHAQGTIFREAGSLEASWIENDVWHGHQRLELETDLIAAHLLAIAWLPTAQFLG